MTSEKLGTSVVDKGVCIINVFEGTAIINMQVR